MGLIKFRVNLEEKELFDKAANEEGVTLSYWIRETLLKTLARAEELKPKSIQEIKEVIKNVEKKYEEPKKTRTSVARETYQKDGWVDPI